MPRFIRLPKLPGRGDERAQTKHQEGDAMSETHAARLERILELPKTEPKTAGPAQGSDSRQDTMAHGGPAAGQAS
jgi:hypothetical protein